MVRTDILKPMLIVGNWKSYVETPETAKVVMAAAKRAAMKSRAKIVIAPSFAHIGLFAGGKKSKVGLAAQDVSEMTAGNATGEVSATTLKRMGVSYVIVGHSERRARGETDATVSTKVTRVLANGMTPILCVGESVRDANAEYLQKLRTQIDAVIKPLPLGDRAKVIVAYEPIWAIGKSATEADSPRDVAEMMLYIRKILAQHLPEKLVPKAVILYGGSVEPANARAFAKEGGVGGFLVGHASADPKMFSDIIKEAS